MPQDWYIVSEGGSKGDNFFVGLSLSLTQTLMLAFIYKWKTNKYSMNKITQGS